MSASFSPDGRKVVAADEFSFAPSVWDWQSANQMYDLDPWQDYIGSPVVSADGRYVAAGDYSGNVIVWELESGKITAQLSGGDGSKTMMVAAVPGSSWFAEANLDGTVRLWDPERPETPQQTLGEKGGSPIQVIEVSADGAHLASVSLNREVEVWRLADGERVQVFEGPQSTNSDIAFSPDGSLLAIGAADASVHIWRWADKHKLAVLHRHGDFVNSVQFTDEGGLVTASDDST
jgi:WD40 repeat protein